MAKRVVITGMGVVAPNTSGIPSFTAALKKGQSGITYIPETESFKLVCKYGGIPSFNGDIFENEWAHYEAADADMSIKYAITAALEAWKDAGFVIPTNDENTNDNAGTIIGTTFGGFEIFMRKVLPMVSSGNVKRLGSQIIEHFMPSGAAAFIAKILALSNQTTSNSSACATGLEAIVMAYDRIKYGKAEIMLAGGTEPYSPYCWAGFDAMRLLSRTSYDDATLASRPMSASAAGFVPAAGAGVLLVEEMTHALKRNASIYAEIVGTDINSGGQRKGGTMTFPNPYRVIDCIRSALQQANISGDNIDLISGHLTGTKADNFEVNNWLKALSINKKIPFINAPKSMLGHTIGAAGAIETIAAVLQLKHDFVHSSLNSEDLHPEIAKLVPREKIPLYLNENAGLNYVAKASFGFGDVNSCLILKKFS